MSDILERLDEADLARDIPTHAFNTMSDARDEIIRLREALEDCAAYFDDRSDVVWEGVAPNREMRLLTMVQTALGEK